MDERRQRLIRALAPSLTMPELANDSDWHARDALNRDAPAMGKTSDYPEWHSREALDRDAPAMGKRSDVAPWHARSELTHDAPEMGKTSEYEPWHARESVQMAQAPRSDDPMNTLFREYGVTSFDQLPPEVQLDLLLGSVGRDRPVPGVE